MRRCGAGAATCGAGSSARNWSSAPPAEWQTMTGGRYLGLVLLAAAGVLDPGSPARGQATTNVPGLVQEGNYDAGNLGMQMEPAPQTDDAGAVYAVGPWPTYPPPPADGRGRELVQSFCAIWHSTTDSTMQPPL